MKRDIRASGATWGFGLFVMESLILAQNERWRHGLGMQVERAEGNFGEWRKGEQHVSNLPLGSG